MNPEPLAKRLEEVENPDWYMELWGEAYGRTGDANKALELADELYRENPHPPDTEQDKEFKKVAEAIALSGLMRGEQG